MVANTLFGAVLGIGYAFYIYRFGDISLSYAIEQGTFQSYALGSAVFGMLVVSPISVFAVWLFRKRVDRIFMAASSGPLIASPLSFLAVWTYPQSILFFVASGVGGALFSIMTLRVFRSFLRITDRRRIGAKDE
ncbi:putative integral membrane protein [Microbacterium resistens]|uniref:Integral membrane protein n=1 Tax=Microbacterium resistens TaxID=156977 RepID=A0ABU1SHD6_9MICO|nr:hypothetical protein [Microbacterium resistens]MDR6868969.1 putative integral membrane protein [Microbacterium resistens]